MRCVVCILLVGLLRVAHAEPRDEMAEALAAQIDRRPAPAVVPTAGWTAHRPTSTPTKSTAPAPTGVKRAAEQASSQTQAPVQSTVVHQAQAAAQAAAGQVQAEAAKQRTAAHPHPGR